jgi:cytochrome c556
MNALAAPQNRDSLTDESMCNMICVGKFRWPERALVSGERIHPMIKFTVATVVLALGLASSAFAGPADDLVKERQTCMKAQAAAMGVFVPVMKGEKPFDAALHKATFETMDKACENWTKFFSAEAQKPESVESWAKPEIWTDAKGFEAVSTKAYAGHEKLKAATDEASFKTAFAEFGAGCKGCHESFRKPKE